MKIHWNYGNGITCSREAQYGRRERAKKLTNDPARVTCAVCIRKFSDTDVSEYGMKGTPQFRSMNDQVWHHGPDGVGEVLK